MNPDLKRERSKGTFEVEKITNLLDGGRSKTERRRYLEAVIERDPTGVFSNDDNNYLHRTDRHKRGVAKTVRLMEICRKLGIGDEREGRITESKDFPILEDAMSDSSPLSLHWVMFQPNIASLCDDEQRSRWLPMCRDFKMIGCYAQTEIGHGSNIRALETTATFLPESKGGDEGGSWIINSPTLTSGKFWPGTLGRTANHAMVIAQLIDGDGKHRGIHNFLVQLRSMEDHTLLPGIETGDIGPKIGYNNMDNGYAYFRNVKIPRRNMAMRFATVDESGRYRKKTVSEAASKIAYITMMQVRSLIVSYSARSLGVACCITTRYSAVRKQGFAADGKSEVQVLDYTQQQHRIFPLIAFSYCTFFTARKLAKDLQTMEDRIIVTNQPVSKEDVADVHSSSSALKSFTTMIASDGIEEMRRACGGHGFLMCSGLPELYTTFVMNNTVEGDNHMLPQQVVRVLLKLVDAVKADRGVEKYRNCNSYALVPSLRAMLAGKRERCSAGTADDLTSLPTLLAAFRHRAARMLLMCARQIEEDVKRRGSSPSKAWNDALVIMAKASKSYSLFLLLRSIHEGIVDEQRTGAIGRAEADVLTDLAKLHGLWWMEKDLGDFIEDGYLRPDQSAWVAPLVLKHLEKIRVNAVSLVDAFDCSDFKIKSALGRYDGNVYPAILAAAKKDPLNAVDPGPAYDPELKRLIVGGAAAYTPSRL
mmetsp:Transcript_1248/g.3006  ORF Transcript_1248/g.3006 Transcript_1248/m.3006 type:complete len:705 (-) Transcript_1248:128-2242(-)